jgi:hypothetical protein
LDPNGPDTGNIRYYPKHASRDPLDRARACRTVLAVIGPVAVVERDLAFLVVFGQPAVVVGLAEARGALGG